MEREKRRFNLMYHERKRLNLLNLKQKTVSLIFVLLNHSLLFRDNKRL